MVIPVKTGIQDTEDRNWIPALRRNDRQKILSVLGRLRVEMGYNLWIILVKKLPFSIFENGLIIKIFINNNGLYYYIYLVWKLPSLFLIFLPKNEDSFL
jgi:hypothetical protein